MLKTDYLMVACVMVLLTACSSGGSDDATIPPPSDPPPSDPPPPDPPPPDPPPPDPPPPDPPPPDPPPPDPPPPDPPPPDPPPFGMDSRPINLTCLAPPRPSLGTGVGVEEAFPGSPGFSSATKLLQAPGDSSRWFVLEKGGLIRVFDVNDPATVSTYLNYSGVVNTSSEGGMLGMAFHPNFPATPIVFVSYTVSGSPMVSVISRVRLDNTTTPVNPVEEVLITIDQDFSNHNGGDIDFGSDGYLYIGLGDGGSGGDPLNRAQDTTRLLGSMLRIDVLGVSWPNPGYTIPASNPFSGNPDCGPGSNAQACPEIFAWGLRNPWRWSFDQQTGALWAGDVGQNAWEEIDIIEVGGNYGWKCLEGNNFFASGCQGLSLTPPVSEYDQTNGDRSVTGGDVYRGSAIPSLQGRYVFGDFVSGRIWALLDDGQGGFTNEEIIDTSYSIPDFALGEDGELYFVQYTGSGGAIHRLIPSGGGTNTIPDDLMDTGCVDTQDPTQPAAGLIPYDITAPFWSDGVSKSRHIGLPDGLEIDINAGNDWEFPSGSVLVKFFRLNGKLIETRLFMRHPDGVWAGYSYEWNDPPTVATRVIGGKTTIIDGLSWIFPSEGQCMACHTDIAGFSLGPETAQLNRDFNYPSSGITSNQLTTLEHIMAFSAPLTDVPANLPQLTDPMDVSASLEARARAYLHTNCAQCHRPAGPTPSSMDLRYTTDFQATNTCDVNPQSGELGIFNPKLIAPGDASRSILIARTDRRDADGMPPLGSTLVDAAGVALLTAWVNGLSGCP